MGLVSVQLGYINFLTEMTIIGTVGLIAFFVLFIYVIQDKYRTPKQAGNMIKAHRRHIPLILLEGLDHFADLFPLSEFIPEVLQYPIGKGAKKRNYRFILPQKVNVDELDVDVADGFSERKTKQYIQGLNDLNTLKVTLRGVNAPIFVGTKNRSIAASFPFLSALSWTKDIEQLSKDTAVIEALRGHKDSRVKNVGEILHRMSLGVSGVDFHAVYKNIDVNYDHTLGDSISERDKTDGRMEGREDKDKQTKTVLLLIFGICAVLALTIIGLKYL